MAPSAVAVAGGACLANQSGCCCWSSTGLLLQVSAGQGVGTKLVVAGACLVMQSGRWSGYCCKHLCTLFGVYAVAFLHGTVEATEFGM